MSRFEDDVAVVTGSTRGIGAGIARRLAREGATVVIAGRTAADGEAVVDDIRSDGGEARFVRTDLRDLDSIASLFEATSEEYGGLDVLVNNAGVETYTSADKATIENWEFVVETDFRAYWQCGKHAVLRMSADGDDGRGNNGGAIVNVTSNQAIATTPGMFPYNAVKAGVQGMTHAMALDFGPAVCVNGVDPGLIAVARTTNNMDADRRAHLESIHPVGRLGNAFTEFRYVTLPLLAPAITIALLLRSMDLMRYFTKVFITTGGGPASSTKIIGFFVYEQALRFTNFGYGAALGIVMLVVTILIGLFFVEFVQGGAGDE